MTGLHQTPLTTPRKRECAAKALAGQEASGGIAALSREFRISRPTIYTASGVALEQEPRHQLPKIPAGDPKRRYTPTASDRTGTFALSGSYRAV
jgi:hypothetical protein